MRCRNCHTVMMETDVECPGCHASIERATAAAPELTGQPDPMLKMLPMFGGALGGLAYAALAEASTAGSHHIGPATVRSRQEPGQASGANPLKLIFGILLV